MNTTNNTVRFLLVADIHNGGTDGLDPTDCHAAIVAGDFKFHGWSSCKDQWRDAVNASRILERDYDTAVFSPAYATFHSDGTIDVTPSKRL